MSGLLKKRKTVEDGEELEELEDSEVMNNMMQIIEGKMKASM